MADFPASAIFSPSAARQAASTALEWNRVDAWLQRCFRPRPVPTFERNPGTLRELLALVDFSDAAEDHGELVAAAEAEVVDEAISGGYAAEGAGSAVSAVLEAALPVEGRTALAALAKTWVGLEPDGRCATPARAASRAVAMQAELHSADLRSRRLGDLCLYLNRALSSARRALVEVTGRPDATGAPSPLSSPPSPSSPSKGLGHGHGSSSHSDPASPYLPPPHLGRANIDSSRAVKRLAASLPHGSPPSLPLPLDATEPPSVGGLHRAEAGLERLLDRKCAVERRLAEFSGLPPDPALAGSEVEGRRCELASVVARRDMAFETLVAKASPG